MARLALLIALVSTVRAEPPPVVLGFALPSRGAPLSDRATRVAAQLARRLHVQALTLIPDLDLSEPLSRGHAMFQSAAFEGAAQTLDQALALGAQEPHRLKD